MRKEEGTLLILKCSTRNRRVYENNNIQLQIAIYVCIMCKCVCVCPEKKRRLQSANHL